MQPRGWGLTRASRVIILLVVQHVGLGQVLAFPPAPAAGVTHAGPTQATLDAAVFLAIPFDPGGHSSALLGERSSRATRPDPAPLPRRLPRAPPAA